jgi:ribosomal-protein-alanine N-acetyltransferase
MLRRMEISDLPEVLEIEKNCFSNPWSINAFLEVIISDYYYSIVMSKTKITGYGVACFENSKIHILNLAVKQEKRRNKIGTRILNHILKYGFSHKKRRAILEVRSRNSAAISFYRKHNFKKTGIKKNYYQDDDAIIMERKISEKDFS